MVQDCEERNVLRDDGVTEPGLGVDEEAPEVTLGSDLLVLPELEVEGAHQREVLGAVNATNGDRVRFDPEGAVQEEAHTFQRTDRVGIRASVGQHEEAITRGSGRCCPENLMEVGERRAQEVWLGEMGMGFVLRHG